MIKSNKFLTLILGVAFAIAMVSCVQDDDYTVPTSLGNEENAGLKNIMEGLKSGALTEISISDLKALFTGQAVLIEADLVVKGYVSSSDLTGNFYKEFYLQDLPENPTTAMGVMLNQVDSYNQFNQGREVYINLKGLYLGENSSKITSVGGTLDGTYLQNMTANQVPKHIFRSSTTASLTPVVLKPSEVNKSHVGMYVTIENVQFPSSYAGKTFHDPINDFDTRYPLVSCENSSELKLETSSFASFGQTPLPTDGRGRISGVISLGFRGSPIVMLLNTIDDIKFNENRCDPVFEESFNAAVDDTDLDLPGWINYTQAGTKLWSEQVYKGNGYAEFTAFRTNEASNIAWLITPAIDLSAQDGEILTFQTEHAYPDAGHEALKVFISTDFNGSETGVEAANWTELDFTSSLEADFDKWFTFTDSGEIDLSSYEGTAYIAFVYTGSDTNNLNTTIHVDNILIKVP